MQTKQFALGKFVTMLIFVVCLMSLSAGIVFAYVPTLKFNSEINQTPSITYSLSHNEGLNNDVTLFDSLGPVNNADFTVTPIETNILQVKCAYSVIETNKTFSVQNGTAQITDVWVYGVKLTLDTHYTVSGLTLTLMPSIVNVIEDDDEVIINFTITPTPSTAG